VPDQFDFELVDHALLDELEMTTELIIAASQTDAPLSLAEIDRILGVAPASSGPNPVPRPRRPER